MSHLYPKFAEAMGTQSPSVILTSDTLRVSLLRTSAYTYATSHQFKSSIATVQNASGPLTSVTFALGVHDYADPTFTAVPAGAALDAMIEWCDKGGADTANPLISYHDGFSIVPNGGDITMVVDNGANRAWALVS